MGYNIFVTVKPEPQPGMGGGVGVVDNITTFEHRLEAKKCNMHEKYLLIGRRNLLSGSYMGHILIRISNCKKSKTGWYIQSLYSTHVTKTLCIFVTQ